VCEIRRKDANIRANYAWTALKIPGKLHKKYVKPSRITSQSTWGIRWDNVTKAKDTREIHKANSWQIRVKYEKLHLVKITRKNTHNSQKS
jgi:hypothetical protein